MKKNSNNAPIVQNNFFPIDTLNISDTRAFLIGLGLIWLYFWLMEDNFSQRKHLLADYRPFKRKRMPK